MADAKLRTEDGVPIVDGHSMGLMREVPHPIRHHFVLKLDRAVDPSRGQVSGRVENLVTGGRFDFVDAASLLKGLSLELAATESLEPEPRD